MHKYKFEQRKIKKIIVLLIIVTFIGTTAFSSMTGASINTSQISRINTNKQVKTLQYIFVFEEPSLIETSLFQNSFTKVTVPGTITLGNNLGEPALPVFFAKILLPPETLIKEIFVKTPKQKHHRAVLIKRVFMSIRPGGEI